MISINNMALLRPAFYYALLTGLVLAVIYLFSLWPALNESKRTRSNIELLEARIQEQEMLAPAYARLTRILDQDVAVLPEYPAPGFFPRAEGMEEVMDALRQAALLSGLKINSFSPDLRSLQQGSEIFMVRCDLSGEFLDFREFLLNLVSGPNFNRLESLEIDQTLQGSRYRLRIFMSLS
jgi:Tfp pilus assembly protein PilO